MAASNAATSDTASIAACHPRRQLALSSAVARDGGGCGTGPSPFVEWSDITPPLDTLLGWDRCPTCRLTGRQALFMSPGRSDPSRARSPTDREPHAPTFSWRSASAVDGGAPRLPIACSLARRCRLSFGSLFVGHPVVRPAGVATALWRTAVDCKGCRLFTTTQSTPRMG